MEWGAGASAGYGEFVVGVPNALLDKATQGVKSDARVKGGTQVVKGINFLIGVGGRRGEGVDDLPGNAGALAALVWRFVENDDFAFLVGEEQAVIGAPSLRELHKGEKLGRRGGDEGKIINK